MENLKNYILENGIFNEFYEYDEEENVYYYEYVLTIKFNNKYYTEKYFTKNKEVLFKNYLVDKAIIKVIEDLGKEKLLTFFN